MSDKSIMQAQQNNAQDKPKYVKPAIRHEVKLETRAGSPLSNPDGLDLTGVGDS
jgi:hypothetical protein